MTSFSLEVRHLECRGCGAALILDAGDRVRCNYCGAEYQVEMHRDDGREPLSPAEDLARLSRLRGQLEHPIVGHIYDLDEVPAVARAHGGAAEKLESLWVKLKDPAVAGTDSSAEQHALCWAALHSSRLMLAAGVGDRARARLELALDLLRDSGHRHLIRCALAEAAVGVGELDAAEDWLAHCDQAAEVLELDTAYRWARVRCLLARGRIAEVETLVGASASAIPVTKKREADMGLVRAHLQELAGDIDAAIGTYHRIAVPGLATRARALGLIPKSRHRLKQRKLTARCQRAMQELADRKSKTVRAGRFMFSANFVTLVLVVLLSIVGMATGRGPLFGLEADALCAHTCETCTGPYKLQNVPWEPYYGAICERPVTKEIRRFNQWHEEVVPGGAWTLGAMAYLLYLPLIVLGLALKRFSMREQRRAKTLALEEKIASLQARIEQPVSTPKPPWKPALLINVAVVVVAISLLVVNLLLR
ncbi:hypothetical protein G6O69_15870 [Pseudenhygromyxa sp. WMMC2535]|uniref:hypothetical protein n=1 Tax=Pseudenhygromyxa sp. WMMC2535 TaxID=2712867 RepID=UPI001557F6BE|nr:hypothetical protein [Pseudenhygromyxa sp. WMMC2535]NVB39321.1 hypothetical protein [Pseudenhygromyxa sp. WMMC2535]